LRSEARTLTLSKASIRILDERSLKMILTRIPITASNIENETLEQFQGDLYKLPQA
jgi:hypothetical protein